MFTQIIDNRNRSSPLVLPLDLQLVDRRVDLLLSTLEECGYANRIDLPSATARGDTTLTKSRLLVHPGGGWGERGCTRARSGDDTSPFVKKKRKRKRERERERGEGEGEGGGKGD